MTTSNHSNSGKFNTWRTVISIGRSTNRLISWLFCDFIMEDNHHSKDSFVLTLAVQAQLGGSGHQKACLGHIGAVGIDRLNTKHQNFGCKTYATISVVRSIAIKFKISARMVFFASPIVCFSVALHGGPEISIWNISKPSEVLVPLMYTWTIPKFVEDFIIFALWASNRIQAKRMLSHKTFITYTMCLRSPISCSLKDEVVEIDENFFKI